MSEYGFTFSKTVPLKSNVYAPVDSIRKERKMRRGYKAMKVKVGSLQNCELK